jgi:hypothetical protein
MHGTSPMCDRTDNGEVFRAFDHASSTNVAYTFLRASSHGLIDVPQSVVPSSVISRVSRITRAFSSVPSCSASTASFDRRFSFPHGSDLNGSARFSDWRPARNRKTYIRLISVIVFLTSCC